MDKDLQEKYLELYKRLNDSQQKYVYFILGINVAAIGFLIQFILKTEKALVFDLFILIPISSFGVSFFLGCKYILNTFIHIKANMKLFKGIGDNYQKSIDNANETMENINKIAYKQFNNMFNFLIGGVITFITWFVIKILMDIIQ